MRECGQGGRGQGAGCGVQFGVWDTGVGCEVYGVGCKAYEESGRGVWTEGRRV